MNDRSTTEDPADVEAAAPSPAWWQRMDVLQPALLVLGVPVILIGLAVALLPQASVPETTTTTTVEVAANGNRTTSSSESTGEARISDVVLGSVLALGGILVLAGVFLPRINGFEGFGVKLSMGLTEGEFKKLLDEIDKRVADGQADPRELRAIVDAAVRTAVRKKEDDFQTLKGSNLLIKSAIDWNALAQWQGMPNANKQRYATEWLLRSAGTLTPQEIRLAVDESLNERREPTGDDPADPASGN